MNAVLSGTGAAFIVLFFICFLGFVLLFVWVFVPLMAWAFWAIPAVVLVVEIYTTYKMISYVLQYMVYPINPANTRG